MFLRNPTYLSQLNMKKLKTFIPNTSLVHDLRSPISIPSRDLLKKYLYKISKYFNEFFEIF